MTKSKDDLGLVLRAVQFAALKHKDQRRKDAKATPYINHPISLGEVLHTVGGVRDPVVIAAALLHDTIEKTETTYRELQRLFGKEVASVVREVTDDKALPKVKRRKLQIEHGQLDQESSSGEAGRQDLQFAGYSRQSAS